VPNYTYQWYFGSSATPGNELQEGVDPGNLSSPTDVNTATVSGLSAGNYTVVVTETSTGCLSAIETITVVDEVSPYKPNVQFSADIIPNSCEADNGQITAEIVGLNGTSPSGGGQNFTFEWYEGAQDFASLELTGSAVALNTGDNLVANPSGNTVIVTDNGITGVGATTTLNQIVSGLYTVVMIDQATDCRYFEVYDLGFAGQQVTTTLTIDNVTECPDNGAARVGLADNIILGVNSGTQTGIFTVGEAFTATGGKSGTIAADNGTGQVQVTLNDLSPALSTGDVITETSSGFTAEITSISNVGYATGLNEFDDISQYTIYLYSGSGVPPGREANPYQFEGLWFPYSYNPATGVILDGQGDAVLDEFGAPVVGPALAAGDEAEFSQLPAGSYVAIAREIDNPAFNPGSTSNCYSAASLDEEILDLAYEPIIQSTEVTNNTGCDPVNSNGQLSITVIESPEESLLDPGVQQPDGYRFTWTRDIDGVDILIEDIFTETATSTTTADLAPGDYTVLVERLGSPGNTSNNCSVTTTLTVGDNPEQHIISNALITGNVDCDPLDGSAEIRDIDITDDVSEYTFNWYFDAGATNLLDNGDAPELANLTFPNGANGTVGASAIANVPEGSYYVQAIRTGLSCETPVFEVVIEGSPVIPSLGVTATANDITCDDINFAPTGEATATVQNGSMDVDEYVFTWYMDPAGTNDIDNGDIPTVSFDGTGAS
jgi:hypothetical protein